MTRPSLAEALSSADLIHDHQTISHAIQRLGTEINAELKGETPVFLTVMNGGLVFSGALSLSISTDLEFDYLHATRYRGTTNGQHLHWLARPKILLKNRTVLIIDDILDEGQTLKAIRDFCLEQGARRVLIAVLCLKRHGRCVEGISANFVGLEVPDRYVFGYGMDYYEQGRNLPAIYAT